jgi:hypothetical protein
MDFLEALVDGECGTHVRSNYAGGDGEELFETYPFLEVLYPFQAENDFVMSKVRRRTNLCYSCPGQQRPPNSPRLRAPDPFPAPASHRVDRASTSCATRLPLGLSGYR